MRNVNSQNGENIRAAALPLFIEKGYENVSIKEICREAGCSQSTFYYQFGTKEKLLQSYGKVHNVIDQSIMRELLTMTSAWEKLWRIHESFSELSMQLGPALYANMFISSASNSINWSATEGVIQSTELIVPLIAQGQTQGEIRNHTPAAELAMTVTLQMIGVTCMWSGDNGSYDLKSVMKKHLRNLYDLREDILI